MRGDNGQEPMASLDPQRLKKLSKSLSLVLRHRPERVGLTLDEGGWVDVDRLLAAMNWSRETLDQVVRENDKQRFAFDPSGTKVRASQGHSVPVDLGLENVQPPDVLYHGTPEASIGLILTEGLNKMRRHAVHLSPDVATARRVGLRRGRCAVLAIDARRMADDGHAFQRSENGVWLTEFVPPEYIHLAN